MRIAVAADHGGYRYKQEVASWLRAAGHEVIDLGAYGEERVDYPDFGAAVGRAVAGVEGSPADLGVCVCGSGIGIAMAANKIKGVRAAVVHDKVSAALARRHNDANVVCFGQRLMEIEEVLESLEEFLSAEFEGGRHAARVDKLNTL